VHNKDYRSTSGLCLLDWAWFKNYGVSREQVIETLTNEFGFELEQIDLLYEARQLVGTGIYTRRARLADAPELMDCSSMVVHLYSQIGVEVPRLAIDQRAFGQPIDVEQACAGDLIFTSGRYGYYDENPGEAVGHVGMLTGEGSVIHANNKEISPPVHTVDEVPLESFLRGREFRGACRILPPTQDRLIFSTNPTPGMELSWSKEIAWRFSTTLSW
jgi:hypothetical protein